MLDRLFVEAQRDWDGIASGKCTDVQIRRLLHKIRSRKQRYEANYIPNGLARRKAIFTKAQNEMAIFFKARYASIGE